MTTFAKLNNGEIMVVFSDNIDEETMHLIPKSQWKDCFGGYDSEWMSCEKYSYSDIKCTASTELMARDEINCHFIKTILTGGLK